MKPPEEIKKGQECCNELMDCRECPYNQINLCCRKRERDTMAYIQQLEQDNAQKDERIRQLEREKEAAVADLAVTKNCKVCKYVTGAACEEPCWSCGIAQRNWEWRGVDVEK